MPIYTYRCRDCNHQFEQRQRMTDDPLTECPVCNGNVRRVVNSVGVVFKGSGFYVTDNRTSSSANGASRSTASNVKAEKETADHSSESSKATKPESTAA